MATNGTHTRRNSNSRKLRQYLDSEYSTPNTLIFGTRNGAPACQSPATTRQWPLFLVPVPVAKSSSWSSSTSLAILRCHGIRDHVIRDQNTDVDWRKVGTSSAWYKTYVVSVTHRRTDDQLTQRHRAEPPKVKVMGAKCQKESKQAFPWNERSRVRFVTAVRRCVVVDLLPLLHVFCCKYFFISFTVITSNIQQLSINTTTLLFSLLFVLNKYFRI